MRSQAKASFAGSSSGPGAMAHRCTRTSLLSLAIVFAAFALLPTPALAQGTHVFSSSFGSAGQGDGQFELGEHSGVAVNESTHDVYIADTGNHRVDQFDSGGAFIRSFGADVGGAGVDVCTSGCVAGTSGSEPGAFEAPTLIAIDNDPLSSSFGDVYVGDTGNARVSKFTANGTLVTSWGTGGQLTGHESESFIEFTGIAVDSTGNLFVQESGNPSPIFKFTPDGSFTEAFATVFGAFAPLGIAVDSAGNIYKVRGSTAVAKLSPTGASLIEEIGCECALGVAVDPSNDDLYVARANEVAHYDSAGDELDVFGSSAEITSATGVAVDSGLEAAYVADSGGGRVDAFGPPPPAPPTVGATTALNVTATSAELQAQVNANFFDTHYRFQYVTQAQFEAGGFSAAAETPEVDLGSAGTPQTVRAHLGGLAPDTAYRFRVVAENAFGEATSPEPAPGFPTFPAFPPGLPDGRAYEMVSPPQKVGEVFPPEPGDRLGSSCPLECLPGANAQLMPMQSDPGGDAVVYEGQPFSAGLASGANEYLSNRTAGGWATQSLSPPLFNSFARQGYMAFSSDLSRGVIHQSDPPLSPEAPAEEGAGFDNLYLRGDSGSLQPLITDAPPQRNAEAFGNRFQVVYAGANAGTSSASAFSHLIFEANDALTGEVPGVAPEAPEIGAGEECSGELGDNCNLYEWAGGMLRLVNVLPGNAAAPSGAVIGSGRLLDKSPGNEGPSVDHAISADGSRVFWSEVASGQVYVRIDGEETQKIEDLGIFITASADGSEVLLNDGCLYDLKAKACEDLTAGQGDFQGILGAAEDLSRVYFVDTAVLTGSEENANEEQAETGKFNLYGWHGGATTFIGTLLESDSAGLLGAWHSWAAGRTAQVSSDGRYLAFMSQAPLTGYDNKVSSGECGVNKPPQCPEVFEYDANAGSLTCPSCNPSGAQPLGGSNLSLISGCCSFPPLPQPGNLTGQGQGRLFFESQDVLSPRDANGHIQDVYEWEPNGVGSCQHAGGCVFLISSGHSANGSVFLNSTPSGDDVFFITREQIALADKDEFLDLYDAKVSGGLSSETETVRSECQGEACQPAANVPNDPTPSSSSFQGAGNLKEKPKHHKRKKHKRHAKKRHHKRANYNRGGAK